MTSIVFHMLYCCIRGKGDYPLQQCRTLNPSQCYANCCPVAFHHNTVKLVAVKLWGFVQCSYLNVPPFFLEN